MTTKVEIEITEKYDKTCMVTLRSHGKKCNLWSEPSAQNPLNQVLSLIPELIQSRIEGRKRFEKSKES